MSYLPQTASLASLSAQLGLSTAAGQTPDQLAAAQALLVRQRPSAYALGTLPVNMATPPTITVTGPGGATQLTGAALLPYNAAGYWNLYGGVFAVKNQFSTNYWRNVVNTGRPGTPSTRTPYMVEFAFVGQKFELLMRPETAAASLRVRVDGQLAPISTKSDYSPGSAYHLMVDLGSRAHRRIAVDFDQLDFGGIYLLPTDTIYALNIRRPKVVVLGDSFVFGTGATNQFTSFASQMGVNLGWDLRNCGEGGTGWLSPGDITYQMTIPERITADVIPQNPDLILIGGGTNDTTTANAAYTAAALQAAVTAGLNTLRAALPNTPVVVLSAWVPGNTSSSAAARSAAGAAVLAGAAAVPSVISIDTTNWVTGSGTVGAPAGNGSADILVSADGIHPTQFGHDHLATRIPSAALVSLI